MIDSFFASSLKNKNKVGNILKYIMLTSYSIGLSILAIFEFICIPFDPLIEFLVELNPSQLQKLASIKNVKRTQNTI